MINRETEWCSLKIEFQVLDFEGELNSLKRGKFTGNSTE